MSCQTYIFKRYSSPAIQWRTTFNLKCIFVHSHAHPLSKNWLSQIFLKNRIQIDANDLNLIVAKCIFSKCPPHQHYSGEQPTTSNAYLSTPMLTLWVKIGWDSIFLNNRFQIDANYLNLRVAKYIYSKIHRRTTFNLKCIFFHSHAHPLSKNWLSQHIFKKQIPNWRKWPQFVSCQTYIFKMYSSPAIQWRTTFNLKCIFVHSHAHPLSKNWLSQHIPKKQNPNWRKWPQFDGCQMYIFKMSSSPALQWRTTYNLKCIFVHSHAHPLSKNWLSQHIPKQQIPNWRKWPQFESCQIYIFINTPENNLQPKMHICPLPCTPFEQKLAEPAYS